MPRGKKVEEMTVEEKFDKAVKAVKGSAMDINRATGDFLNVNGNHRKLFLRLELGYEELSDALTHLQNVNKELAGK